MAPVWTDWKKPRINLLTAALLAIGTFAVFWEVGQGYLT
jgi:hypothetical protein